MRLFLGTAFLGLFTLGMWQFWRITFGETLCPWCRSWMLTLEEYRCGCARYTCETCNVEFYSSPCCGSSDYQLLEGGLLDNKGTRAVPSKDQGGAPSRPARPVSCREGEW